MPAFFSHELPGPPMDSQLDGKGYCLAPTSPVGIFDLVRSWADKAPSAPALLAPDRDPTTFAQLATRIERTVAALNAAGIGPGDRVATILPDGPETGSLLLALTAGVSVAPLNPGLRLREIEVALSELRPRALILRTDSGREVAEAAQRASVPLVTMRSDPHSVAGAFTLDLPAGEEPCFATPDHIALILPTSGTTARPKLVPLTQLNLLASARSIASWLELSSRDRCLGVMPLFHIHGFVASVLASLAAGGSVICSDGFRPGRFFDLAAHFDATWYTAVPTIHQAVLAEAHRNPDGVARVRFRFIRSCSAALPPSVMVELERVFGVPVVEAYGMTEASHQIACNPLPPAPRKPGSVGLPAGAEIALLKDGELVGRGSSGDVLIRGPALTAGYIGIGADVVAGGWFRSGDVGRIDADGYLFLEGRVKEMINRGGEKIAPREIEEVLLEHAAVAEAVAFATPDARLGETVCAAVVLRAAASPNRDQHTAESELRAHVATHLAQWKTPERILIVQQIPKGPTGKVQRIGMAARLGLEETRQNGQPDQATSRPKIEAVLVAIWRSVLGIEQVRPTDDFFDAGGDSIMALQLLSKIERVTGVRLSMGALLGARTVEKMAALVNSGDATLREPRLAVVQAGGAKRPFFCVDAGPMYRALAARLGADQPLLSLYCPDARQLSAPYTLESLAAYHIDTIRAVQPEGPYLIGGWCAAGVIAYEMAVQLTSQGEAVGLLALFDAPNPAAPRGKEFPKSGRLTMALSLGAILLRGEDPGRGREYFTHLSQQLRRQAAVAFYDLSTWAGRPVRVRDAELAYDLGLRSYRPKPYAGPVLLFSRGDWATARYKDERLGWDGFLEHLDVRIIPGDHRQMFLEPQVGTTAAELRDRLRAF
jgi:acyl-CoA synthetase (AMP-forming)/AMP-acid ligase II/thioesterase domain-containing protein/acyl carrier protein